MSFFLTQRHSINYLLRQNNDNRSEYDFLKKCPNFWVYSPPLRWKINKKCLAPLEIYLHTLVFSRYQKSQPNSSNFSLQNFLAIQPEMKKRLFSQSKSKFAVQVRRPFFTWVFVQKASCFMDICFCNGSVKFE